MDIPYYAYKTGRDALTEKEVETLFSKITTFHDEVLLGMAISTGMRREDVVSIELSNIKKVGTPSNDGFYFYEIAYWEKKRKRMWKTRLSGQIAQRLAQYINILPKNCRYLFPSKSLTLFRTKHLSSKTAYNIFQNYLTMAGLKRRPFHALRATCMKLAKRRGYTIEQVMELTGDSYRTIQEHYITPSDDEMKEITVRQPILSPEKKYECSFCGKFLVSVFENGSERLYKCNSCGKIKTEEYKPFA